MNEPCLHELIHGKSRRIFYVIHNQIIACVQWYRVNIWKNLLSIKKKSFFPGLTLLLAGFLAGMLIPNFIYRFSWKQQAFSAVYLLENLWEKQKLRNRLSFADSLDARRDFSFSNLWFYCIWSPYGNYGDAFYLDWESYFPCLFCSSDLLEAQLP